MVDKDQDSNQLVVNEVLVDAAPDEVWELLSTEEGRDAWLEPDSDRTILVESEQAPDADSAESGRISWWWWAGDDAPRHVELWVIGVPAGTRVLAIESAPALPIQMLARAFALA